MGIAALSTADTVRASKPSLWTPCESKGERWMLHLTLRQLRVFEATARLLSFSRAAEELHLTQPGVSGQLKHLEESIGMPLFEQMGRRIFLTEAGRQVYSHTRSIQQQ